MAILTLGLKLGINIENWRTGGNSSEYWVNALNISKFSSDDNTFALTLDDWDSFTKNKYISYALGHMDNLVDFFGELRLLEDESGIDNRGVVYTPSWLSEKITKSIYGHWHRLHRSGKVPKLIADVSCGTGSFLFQATKFFGNDSNIVGLDIDPKALLYCELLSHVLQAKWSLYERDSLLNNVVQPEIVTSTNSTIQAVDVLLGNPPYISSQHLTSEYANQLRKAYPNIIHGNFDLSILFLDQATRVLSEGGIASYILTSKFMTSKYGKTICERLASVVRIINIEDFGDIQLFNGRTTYTCLLTLANLPPTKRFTITTYPAGLNYSQRILKGQSYTLPSDRLMNHPWEFANGEEETALYKLRNPRNPLITDIFSEIIQGVRTGANQVYIIDPLSTDLESDLLLRFVSGEDIRRMKSRENRFKLLFPYKRNDFDESILYSEDELKQKYPKTWNYLESKKPLLIDRSLEKKSEWYGYSRTQNLNSAWIRKLLVREMMPRSELAADFTGELAFSSGYALVANKMSDNTLLLWEAVLNTPTMEFVLRKNGTQLHSGWFRLLKHHLSRVRLPLLNSQILISALGIAEKLKQLPDDENNWKKLDDIVANSFGLTPKERNSILNYLRSFHERSLSESTNSSISLEEPQDPQSKFEPIRLVEYDKIHIDKPQLRKAVTFIENKKLPIHRWYPLTQGFSESLVLELLKELKANSQTIVLDPFTGCGTTNLVCRLEGVPSIGIEVSPLLSWLSHVKINTWEQREIEDAIQRVKRTDLVLGNPEGLLFQSYLSKAYSPFILKQIFGIAQFAKKGYFTKDQEDFLLAGLIGITEEVSFIRKHGSHYRFINASENIGLQKLNIQLISPDADIKSLYINKLDKMLRDIRRRPMPKTQCLIIRGDATSIPLKENSVDIVITSPPYLNRNNYIAQQKIELSLLGFITNYEQYKELVHQTIRSHVEALFDKEPKSRYEEVISIVKALSTNENNNPKIPHMIAGYFEDLGHVIQELSRIIKKGGKCAFVVANSRWGGVVVPVDHLLMKIAEQNKFIASRIYITRMKGNSPQQMRKFGRIPLRESIIIFEKI